jgi:lipoate-protein ligase A
MKEPISELMRMGTIGSIFLSVLLIALVAFAVWARQLISSQLKLKDDRITYLESAVADLEKFNRTELMVMISDNNKMMQKFIDTHERLEDIIKDLKRN